MTRIAFIGLGNMGGGMAANQAKAGHAVTAFDLSARAGEGRGGGLPRGRLTAEAVSDAEVVMSMLPAGPGVRAVYGDELLTKAPKQALLIDCSTIDVESARAVAADAKARGFRFADAPVSGGTAAAEGGTLAFMVGCDAADFAAVEESLAPMARAVIRAGDHGAGQAAKICNNMVLGISMIGVCEAFALAEKLGLDPDRFFEIATKSSGQCWSLSNYSPSAGPGARRALEQGLRRRLRHGHDAQGPEAGPEAAARSGATAARWGLRPKGCMRCSIAWGAEARISRQF